MVSLKFFVCSLQSVQRLHSVQNDTVMNTPRNWLFCGEYTGIHHRGVNLNWFTKNLLVQNTWSCQCQMSNTCQSTSLWWIPLGVDFLVYLEQTSEQVNKKTFWWQIDQGVKTSQCKKIIRESWLHGGFCISSFFVNQIRLTPRCIRHWEVSTPRVVNTLGSQLPIQITSRVF
jgi:hypothetical protein